MIEKGRFPNGLQQPPQSARFSEDTLLLASFAAKMAPATCSDEPVLELGCGCGAALFGLALLRPVALGIGIERESCLVEAARKNAIMLALEDSLEFYEGDLASLESPLLHFREKCALVLANPPWRVPGQGKVCQSGLRERAYWEVEGTLTLFLEKATFFLKHHGFLCLALPIWQLGPLFQAVAALPLGIRLLLPVSSFADREARRLLILCRKNTACDFKLMAPLALWEKTADKPRYTKEAREFCPWLDAPVKPAASVEASERPEGKIRGTGK